MSALQYFEEIVKIPRPSGHEEKIRKYLKSFAVEHQLTCIEDSAGNVVIRRGSRPIILQGHVDIVPEAVKPHDFLTEGVTTFIKDGWMYADGTTLGADNGAGVALMLSALASEELADVPLECLFTVDEEAGMTGVSALASDVLEGHVLINLDHEDGGSILVGCAGGINTDAVFPKIPVRPKGDWYTLKISGLRSGHSGQDIHLGRANAVKLASDFLENLEAVQIAEFIAGSKCNVIPKEAVVTFSTTAKSALLFEKYTAAVFAKYADTDPEISLTLERAATPDTAYDGRFIHALHECPNGVLASDGRGVITSTNLAAVSGGDDGYEGFRVITLQRSAVNQERDAVSSATAEVFASAGAQVNIHSKYSGWILAPSSPLLARVTEEYRRIFGYEPRIETTHAGVECGMIQEKYPYMQIISLGPTIESCHTVHERLSLASLEETERFLFALIRSLHKYDCAALR